MLAPFPFICLLCHEAELCCGVFWKGGDMLWLKNTVISVNHRYKWLFRMLGLCVLTVLGGGGEWTEEQNVSDRSAKTCKWPWNPGPIREECLRLQWVGERTGPKPHPMLCKYSCVVAVKPMVDGEFLTTNGRAGMCPWLHYFEALSVLLPRRGLATTSV